MSLVVTHNSAGFLEGELPYVVFRNGLCVLSFLHVSNGSMRSRRTGVTWLTCQDCHCDTIVVWHVRSSCAIPHKSACASRDPKRRYHRGKLGGVRNRDTGGCGSGDQTWLPSTQGGWRAREYEPTAFHPGLPRWKPIWSPDHEKPNDPYLIAVESGLRNAASLAVKPRFLIKKCG